MMFHAVTHHFDHFPTRTLLGACLTQFSPPIEANFSAEAASCGYVTHGSSALSLTLGPAADAIELQWTCVGSVSLNWSVATIATMIGLLLLAALPFAAVWHVRRRPRPSQQWPAAPRSPLAWGVLLISWLLCLAGASPPLLAYVGDGWRWQTGPYTALVVLGLPGLLASIRPDDHPTSACIIRSTFGHCFPPPPLLLLLLPSLPHRRRCCRLTVLALPFRPHAVILAVSIGMMAIVGIGAVVLATGLHDHVLVFRASHLSSPLVFPIITECEDLLRRSIEP